MRKPHITPIDKEIEIPDNKFLVSKTDTRGIIKYANTTFIEISGYTEKELIGSNHNIIRHPDMPRAVFKLLWDTIQSGKEFWGYVKNLAKDGSYYWVFAHVTPSYDTSGTKIIGFHSDRRKPRKEAVLKVSQIYAEIKKAEAKGGLEAGLKKLNEILETEGKDYAEFVFSI
ncbi:MAG TPA: PAS domain S-box protein [Hydrogenothermaceae bacterium]|nr:PAS domain S-box protein [Hydrogenothermaceae bacterium]